MNPSFKDYFFLNESVTLRVAGAPEPGPTGVLDVIHKASHFIWYKSRWAKEAPEWLGDITSWSPDTSHHSYNDPKGTINWYPPEGVPEEAQVQIINDVAQHIQQAGLAEVINVRKEISGSTEGIVHRIDIEVNESEEGAPEVQMSNSNAHEMLENVLGIYDSEIDARDLLIRIDSYIDEVDINAGIREPRDERGEKGARIIDPGIDADYINQRLEQIRAMAEWAIDNGYTTLHAS